MSSVSPPAKPRSAGHFYATGSHLVDVANNLILANRVKRDTETGTEEELAEEAAEKGAVGAARGGSGKFAEVVTQLLEVEHLVAEELRTADPDLRDQEQEQEQAESRSQEEAQEVETETPPPSYHSPPPDLPRSPLDYSQRSPSAAWSLVEDRSLELGPQEAMSPPDLRQHPKRSCALAGLAATVACIALIGVY